MFTKVSIVVPVYNVEKYIVRCFNSVKSQNYSNLECIFVDDCSPDNSSAILKQLIDDYHGPIVFRIVKHDKNKGLSGARNTGTNAASGDYIYYLDSDDEITQDCIETLVKVLIKYPQAKIVQGNTKSIPQSPNDWRDITPKGFPEYSSNAEWIKKHCLKEPRIPVNAWNKLIKKDFLIKNQLFFKEGIIHEDEHWMFFVAKCLDKIAFSKTVGYIHYVVPNSIMQSQSNRKSLLSWLEIIKDLNDHLDSNQLSLQKKYIYQMLRINIQRINTKKDPDLLNAYQKYIENQIKVTWVCGDLSECIFLLLMKLPSQVYSSYIIQKIAGLILKAV